MEQRLCYSAAARDQRVPPLNLHRSGAAVSKILSKYGAANQVKHILSLFPPEIINNNDGLLITTTQERKGLAVCIYIFFSAEM